MAGELRVATAHVHELSAKQDRAAAGVTAAVGIVEGVDAAVTTTHGRISAATSAAVTAVLTARRAAGTKTAHVSQELGTKLTRAGSAYDRTDTSMGGALDGNVR